MASRIAKECSAIQRGSGDKIGMILTAFSGTVCGFTFAFMWGWELSLILLIGLQLLGGMGMMMAVLTKKGVTENMKAYA